MIISMARKLETTPLSTTVQYKLTINHITVGIATPFLCL